DHGAKVINLSLAGPTSPVIASADAYAISKDVVVVAGAGNDAANAPGSPGADPGVVAVAATDRSGDSVWWSDFGPWIDLAGPGVDIVSLGNDGGKQTYAVGSGTSFAAPLVAGAAALVRSWQPSWSESAVV